MLLMFYMKRFVKIGQPFENTDAIGEALLGCKLSVDSSALSIAGGLSSSVMGAVEPVIYLMLKKLSCRILESV